MWSQGCFWNVFFSGDSPLSLLFNRKFQKNMAFRSQFAHECTNPLASFLVFQKPRNPYHYFIPMMFPIDCLRGCRRGCAPSQVSKDHELCIKNGEFCIKNEECLYQKRGMRNCVSKTRNCVSKTRNSVLKTTNFVPLQSLCTTWLHEQSPPPPETTHRTQGHSQIKLHIQIGCCRPDLTSREILTRMIMAAGDCIYRLRARHQTHLEQQPRELQDGRGEAGSERSIWLWILIWLCGPEPSAKWYRSTAN